MLSTSQKSAPLLQGTGASSYTVFTKTADVSDDDDLFLWSVPGDDVTVSDDDASRPRSEEESNCAFTLVSDEASALTWSEDFIVRLHCRLLMDVRSLARPQTPLEEKLDTLRWIFAEPEKQSRPFSLDWCLRVIGSSPMSPLPYVGHTSCEAIQQFVASRIKAWLRSTLERYPTWLYKAVCRDLERAAKQLERDPQWLNKLARRDRNQELLFSDEALFDGNRP